MTQQGNIKYTYWLVIYQPAYPSFGSDNGEKYIYNKASRRIWRTTTPFLTKNDYESLENENLINIVKLGKMTEEEFNNEKTVLKVL